MNHLLEWSEPIVCTQSLSGLPTIPNRYIKPPSQRPQLSSSFVPSPGESDIPVIDLGGLNQGDKFSNELLEQVSGACKEWGFFQIVNHGISPELMKHAREVWREFFHLPFEKKQEYANSPKTYEGYGSRLGVEKGAILDWNDYFYLHYLPPNLKDHNKWPSLPTSCREVIEEYSFQLVKLGGKLLKILSRNLGLGEEYLQNAFGGEDIEACMRINYYPKCPQPDRTLGLSSHSDPGGITVLLPDDHVSGLQVRKGNNWVTVQPAPNMFIVNIGDQIQVLSNAIYKSIEHRVIVNSIEDRVSIAFFYNPKSNLLLQPAKELVTPDRPTLYKPMTFGEYRLFIQTKGPQGKIQMESLTSRH